ncbi:MAG: helix-turn-helix domain-containing protein [Dysgonamonadaceae bacterium]|jgi:transposase
MKKDIPSKTFHGNIELSVSPEDSVAWKLSMLLEAARNETSKIEDIASRYGYSREHFYVIKNAYDKGGTKALMNKPTGPKTDYVRTESVKKQVIRHRFLDPEANSEVITQKMKQSGVNISQRSVERIINEYGLQKKGYIKQIRQRKN